MQEFMQNHHLEERDMDPEYRQAEEKFRNEATRFHEQEQELRQQLRADVALDEGQRQNAYMEKFSRIKSEFENFTNSFTEWHLRQRQEAHETLYKGRGAKFGELLVQVSAMPNDKLGELLSTATRSGQDDLAQAVGLTAAERHQFGLFQRWAQTDPKRGEALRKLRATPGYDQLIDRSFKAMQPHKADARDLLPTPKDHERVQSAAAAKEATRIAFFNLRQSQPRRQVGSRIS